VPNPWQYTGGYLDSETGLVKLGQRYYDPTLGRFTQLDPKGGGYVYAGDNPTTVVDPTGLGCIGSTYTSIFGGSDGENTCIDPNSGKITLTSSFGTSFPPCDVPAGCGSISFSSGGPSSSGSSVTSSFSSGPFSISDTVDSSGNHVGYGTSAGTPGSPDPSVSLTFDFTTLFSPPPSLPFP